MIPQILQNSKLRFCRIRKKTKKPFEKDWTNKPYTFQEIQKYLPEENYGILCGIGDLAVIDSDNESLQLAIENILPDTYKVKTGGGGTHNYFFIPNLKQKIILELDDKDKTHLGEVQSLGTQVVAPNSIHPNGKKYEEINQHNITTISYGELFELVKPFIKKQIKEVEESAKFERTQSSEIDDLSITNIWGTTGLKDNGKGEYFGCHPVHGSAGGVNFWINPSKNTWHCFRCNSGGGALSAIAVKEGIIDCSEARRGNLRGVKAIEAIEKAKTNYGLNTIQQIEEVKTDKKDIQNYNIIWEHELKDYEEEEREWIIDKLIPSKAIAILTGKRGTLKTFLTLQMAYAITSGKAFLGKYPTNKGVVIYLDKENGINIMKKRTAMMREGLEMNGEKLDIGFICFSEIKLDKLGGICAIEQVIEEHHPILLIIDTYRRSVGFDENDAGKVSELFVDTLRPMVERYNTSILLIHHNRKSSGYGEVADEMDELRGSSDLANYADIILKLERKGDSIILKQLKNRNAEEEKPIRIRAEFSENSNSDTYVKLNYEGEFLKQSKSEKCSEALILWITEKDLKQFKTADAKTIAFKGGFKESTFKNSLNELENMGVIENIGFGLYKTSN